MANTVNGIAAITLDTQRERVNVALDAALRPIEPGTVLRARVFMDTTGDFVIDDPTVGNPMIDGSGNSAGQSIIPVGIELETPVAGTLTFKSKVGANAAITISLFPLAANGGLFVPISGRQVFAPTDAGGQLIANMTGISGPSPLNFTLYYLIADKMVFKG